MFSNIPGTSWAQLLKQFRLRAEQSKSALARALGVSAGYISKLESGQRPPPEAQRDAIAEVLDLHQQERLAFHVRAEYERADPKCLKYIQLAIQQSDQAVGDVHAEADLNTHQLLQVQYCACAVPIINKVAAGYPREFTDLDYPTGVADSYIAVPDIDDPNAFAFYVFGDSMQPDYAAGSLAIASPNSTAYEGDACFVRFDPSAKVYGCTFKRVYFMRGGKIRLVAINQKYPEQAYGRDQINGIWPVIREYRTIEHRHTRRSKEIKASDRAAKQTGTERRSAAAG